MKYLFTIALTFFSIYAISQPYTYTEHNPALETEKRDKEAFFQRQKDKAFTQLQNCTQGCGNYAADANDPKDPCLLPGLTPKCICSCQKNYERETKSIEQQETTWRNDYIQRERNYENQQKQKQDFSNQNQTNSNTVNSINKSIENAFTPLINNAANNNNEIGSRPTVADNSNPPAEKLTISDNSGIDDPMTLRTIPGPSLSSDRMNRDANDNFFDMRTISGLAYFIRRHSDVDPDRTTCASNGNFNIVRKKNENSASYLLTAINLKKIDSTSFSIRETSQNIYLEFNGEDGVMNEYMEQYNAKYAELTGGLWRSTHLKSTNKGVIKLNKDLLDKNKQYMLKDFIEKMKYFISTL